MGYFPATLVLLALSYSDGEDGTVSSTGSLLASLSANSPWVVCHLAVVYHMHFPPRLRLQGSFLGNVIVYVSDQLPSLFPFSSICLPRCLPGRPCFRQGVWPCNDHSRRVRPVSSPGGGRVDGRNKW